MFPGDDYSTTLFLGDLSVHCTERDIRKLFRPFGTIEAIRIKRGSNAKTNLSYGFIKFSNRQSAELAMEQVNGLMFLGRCIRIGWATGKDAPKGSDTVGSDENTTNTAAPVTSKKETAQIHVSFISKQVDQLISEATIRSLFSNYGEVLDVALKKSQFDKNLRIQNGYGFVHYALTLEGVQGAIGAVNALHQVTIDRITYDCSISHALADYLVAHNIPLPRGATHPSLGNRHGAAGMSGSGNGPSVYGAASSGLVAPQAHTSALHSDPMLMESRSPRALSAGLPFTGEMMGRDVIPHRNVPSGPHGSRLPGSMADELDEFDRRFQYREAAPAGVGYPPSYPMSSMSRDYPYSSNPSAHAAPPRGPSVLAHGQYGSSMGAAFPPSAPSSMSNKRNIPASYGGSLPGASYHPGARDIDYGVSLPPRGHSRDFPASPADHGEHYRRYQQQQAAAATAAAAASIPSYRPPTASHSGGHATSEHATFSMESRFQHHHQLQQQQQQQQQQQYQNVHQGHQGPTRRMPPSPTGYYHEHFNFPASALAAQSSDAQSWSGQSIGATTIATNSASLSSSASISPRIAATSTSLIPDAYGTVNKMGLDYHTADVFDHSAFDMKNLQLETLSLGPDFTGANAKPVVGGSSFSLLVEPPSDH